MLSCGRVIGRLPKLASHAHPSSFYRPLKYVGIVNVGSLRYSDNASDKKTYKAPGSTIKPEDCIPERESQGQSSQKGSGDGGGRKYSYLQILAALILAGVTIYTISSAKIFSSEKSDSQEDESKKKKEGTRNNRRSREKVQVPETSSLIPQHVPYLLIGGGTAAFSAFRSIKSQDPKAKVLVITEEEDYPYMRPPLSKELWYNTDRKSTTQLLFRQWNGTQRSIFYEPQEFYTNVSNLIASEKGGVSVATGWKVTKIDVTKKTVTLQDGYEIKYDKCLIATGASPKNIPVFESNVSEEVKDKVLTFRTKADFLELEENINDPKCKNIVIVGGGFLGSELACSIARSLGSNKKVFQVYKEKHIMAQVLPEYLSEWTTKKVTLEGVHCIPNSEVEDFTYKNGRLSLVLTGNHIIDADQVIVAVGVEPNTELATVSNLETDPEIGGFIVNAELEARNNLWVAGDAACFYDVKLGRRRVEHHDHAVISGRLAGENMTGAAKPYLHQSMFWSDLGPEVGYEAIGIVDSSLPTVGVFAKASETNVPATTPVEASNEVAESPSDQKTAQAQTIVKQESPAQTNKNPNKDANSKEDGDSECVSTEPKEQPEKYDDFEKGVIFYLRDNIVVGIVLWNIFNRMSIARQVLARGTKYDDLNEVAKLFMIHDE